MVVTLTVEWAHEQYQLDLPQAIWLRIAAGEPLNVEGPGYYYEGEHFHDRWCFNDPKPGNLRVTYHQGLEEGDGYVGSIEDAYLRSW